MKSLQFPGLRGSTLFASIKHLVTSEAWSLGALELRTKYQVFNSSELFILHSVIWYFHLIYSWMRSRRNEILRLEDWLLCKMKSHVSCCLVWMWNLKLVSFRYILHFWIICKIFKSIFSPEIGFDNVFPFNTFPLTLFHSRINWIVKSLLVRIERFEEFCYIDTVWTFRYHTNFKGRR